MSSICALGRSCLDILDEQDTKHSCYVYMWTTNYISKYFVNVDCAAWDMYGKWKTEYSQMFFVQRAHCWYAQLRVPPIKMCAHETWRSWILTWKMRRARHKWRSYLKAALKLGKINLIAALDNKSRLQKEKWKLKILSLPQKSLTTLWHMVSIIVAIWQNFH